MNCLLTFLEGLASFISPCMLPLLPVYVAYFAGDGEKSASRTFARALAFVCGFSLLFIALGVFAGSLGRALDAHRTAVDVTCGALVIAFGLGYLGVIRLPFAGLKGARRLDGVISAFVFGFVYSVNLTPCVGAFLGAALMTAAAEGGAAKGAALLAAYSAGLGIPFVLSALVLSRLGGAFGFVKRHYRVINPICGGALILFGIWTAAKPFLASEAMAPAPSNAVETPSQKCGDIPAENRRSRFEGSRRPSAPAVATSSHVEPQQPGHEVVVTGANFEAEVLKADKPVLVDFWAPWCGPCRRLGPHVADLARDMAGKVKVCKINVDDAQDLAGRYGIRGIPALFVFRAGKVVGQAVGYMEKPDLVEFVTSKIK